MSRLIGQNNHLYLGTCPRLMTRRKFIFLFRLGFFLLVCFLVCRIYLVKQPAIYNSFDDECNLGYINDQSRRLAQDDPCVIDIIRRLYLHPPSPRHVPYITNNQSADNDPSDVKMAHGIFRLAKNKTQGFFVECGALDGEAGSTTLYLERAKDWTGILIEANPYNYARLLKRNRKAWSLPVCLSLEPYPTQVKFVLSKKAEAYNKMHNGTKCAWCDAVGHIDSPTVNETKPWELVDNVADERVTVQCFPLYSILLAVGRTTVDFFSLDIEGHELKVLKTVPWDRVLIKNLMAEWYHVPEGDVGLEDYLMRDPNASRYTGNIQVSQDDNIFFYDDDV